MKLARCRSRYFQRLAFVGLIAFFWLSAVRPNAAQAVTPTEAGTFWVKNYIQPQFEAFVTAADRLAAQLNTMCNAATPSEVTRRQTAHDFRSLVLAWSRVEFLRFGPLIEANRYEKISFWPDVRSVGLRQIPKIAALYEKGDAVDLSGQSVAVQGLPAMEYLLYRKQGLLDLPTGELVGQPFATGDCRYALAIAENLGRIGRDIVHDWSVSGRYGHDFAEPGPNNALYRNQTEVVSEGIKALSTGVQFLKDVKLTAKKGKMPYWRSQLANEALVASLSGMREFLLAGQLHLQDKGWAATQFGAELKRAERIIASAPVTESAGDYQAAVLILENAKALLDQDIAPALNVGLGFNALDGD